MGTEWNNSSEWARMKVVDAVDTQALRNENQSKDDHIQMPTAHFIY